MGRMQALIEGLRQGEIAAPLVHMNGTSGKDLLQQVTDAGRALGKAQRALDEAAPNARDYYPRGDAAFREAVAQHQDRAERLRSVHKELEQIAEAIADQMD
jgi:ABC-type transporter Mla subunit MlaD